MELRERGNRAKERKCDKEKGTGRKRNGWGLKGWK